MGSCFSSEGDNNSGGGKSISPEPNFNPVTYSPSQELIRSANRVVIAVRFVAQTVLQNGSNHWVIFLQTGQEEAVRINMDPSLTLGAQTPGHGYRGAMTITHRNHAVTRNHELMISIPTGRQHTVAQFIDTIVGARHHEYDFTTEGRGCTGWILDQYHLFLRQGLIPPKFDAIESAINMEWRQGKPSGGRQATRGFYMKDTRGGGWSRDGAVARR
ncbi:hypothetical protein GLAREA_11279 [Glarea lozoyensis ATCC 20868]|uniref:DUF7770 domain-containing protein n=1 Tax=Glarea lozoyensis (strain ATCC 20868 / MF5171) TaxID=1116229 RepID=S3DEN8_GLAL2|nr:uncharacterized protein GLAREA_11279 [Glarea lozoyensis ATCC 20868]EPE35579.1 hypothetical protein GLAREA_11279 [Glarea lozoyensis ATCC 20868]